MSSATPLVLQDIRRTFVQGDRRLEVLRGASLELRAGEIVALVGQSGSGKSTFLHICGLLERPDGGDFARAYDTRVRGMSSHFIWTNRSKESLTLDLKQPEARQIMIELAKKSDVLVLEPTSEFFKYLRNPGKGSAR